MNINLINCACVIHGNLYDWTYVEKLYSMLCRNMSVPVILHVFTEEDRVVPEPFVKHVLDEWENINGPRKAWWYKMQLFNPKHFDGTLLYFDLDTVITGNLDWILDSCPQSFWAIRDYKYLWRNNWNGINSSVMYWHVPTFEYIWQEFNQGNPNEIAKRYPGDQDFITEKIHNSQLRFFDKESIVSWRWQIKDGGLDMVSRSYRQPGSGSVLTPNASILVFHGKPKPHEVADTLIQHYWQ